MELSSKQRTRIEGYADIVLLAERSPNIAVSFLYEAAFLGYWIQVLLIAIVVNTITRFVSFLRENAISRIVFYLIVFLILSIIFIVAIAKAEPVKKTAKLNVIYLSPEGDTTLPSLQERKDSVRAALAGLPVKLKLVKEVVAVDTCTAPKYEDPVEAMFCYRKIASRLKLRKNDDTLTLAVARVWPNFQGTYTFNGISYLRCGLDWKEFGFAYVTMYSKEPARNVEIARHELLHLLGADHDNFSVNVMHQRALNYVTPGIYLPINLRARKQVKQCFNRRGYKYKTTNF